jgi:hypothetical protein
LQKLIATILESLPEIGFLVSLSNTAIVSKLIQQRGEVESP